MCLRSLLGAAKQLAMGRLRGKAAINCVELWLLSSRVGQSDKGAAVSVTQHPH
jgi:hypothetical protein